MNLPKEASKLLTNKYFLYFVVFLTATNLFGYLATQKYNAIIFFILIGLLTYQFNKNMVIVLLVALFSTSFLLSSKLIREGMTSGSNEMKNKIEKAGDIDPQIKDATKALNETNNVQAAKARLSEPDVSKNDGPTKPKDPNNPDLNAADDQGPEGVGQQVSGKKGKESSTAAPRIDYAATLEESYKNLDNILGGDSIQKLTSDTQKLMAQQQSLFNTMNKMVPVLEGAQNMLKGFDMNSLTKSLQQVGNLGDIKLPQIPK